MPFQDNNYSGGFRRGPTDSGSRREQELEGALRSAREKLQVQDQILTRIKESPTTRGYVVALVPGSPDKVLISVSTQLVEALLPQEGWASNIEVGSCVRVQIDSLQLLDVLDTSAAVGNVAVARKEGENGETEVDFQGNVRTVRFNEKLRIEAGDRVLVDGLCTVIIRNFGPDASKFSYQGVTNISWDDVGGLEDAKADMQEAIEYPNKYPELYKAYGKTPVRGIMLYGPAGCGKTLLAKAAATSLAATYGKSAAETGFIYVKGPELLDKYVGATEANIRALFARGRDHFAKHGYNAILFIDEADALLGKRGARMNMGMETTVVPQFLSEMDGLGDSGCTVLLATNRPDTLDPAVTRDGRIDRKVKITRPTRDGAEAIFRLNLRNKPVRMDVESIATVAADLLFNPQYEIYEIVMKDGTKKSFTLGNLVNGAMIAGMVDNASTSAMRRDIASGGEPHGITVDDFRHAVEKLFTQNLHTNHETELEEFCEPFEADVQGFQKPLPKSNTAEALT